MRKKKKSNVLNFGIREIHRLIFHAFRHQSFKVTRTGLKKYFRTHKNLEANLESISDVYHDFLVKTFSIKTNYDRLRQINSPAVLYCQTGKGLGYFLYGKTFTENYISVYDPLANRTKRIPQNEFLRDWRGVAMYAEPTASSGEKNYHTLRVNEVVGQILAGLFCLVIVAAFTFSVIDLPFPGRVYAIIKLAGLVTSYYLVRQSFEPRFTTRICSFHKKTNCDSVLKSKGASFFGLISLIEIGILYFVGGLLLLLISSHASLFAPAFTLLSFFSLLTLPFSIYTIVYQAFVIKKWCPLCLVVQFLLWVEAVYGISIAGEFTSIPTDPAIWSLVLISFVAATGLAVFFVKSYRQRGLGQLYFQINRFKSDYNIFKYDISREAAYPVEELENEILLGDKNAPLTITVVSDPGCSKCAEVHEDIDRLLLSLDGLLNFRIRFRVYLENTEKSSGLLVRALLKLNKDSPQDIPVALNDWFKARDYKKWMKKYRLKAIEPKEALMPYIEWLRRANIKYSPAILIGGRILPPHWELRYTRAHLVQMTSEMKQEKTIKENSEKKLTLKQF